MSKYFIDDGEVTRIDLGEGQWVDIKTEFTQADLDFISNSQIKIGSIDPKTKKADFDFDLGNMAMLERGVVAWSFPEPVVSDNLSRLRNPMRGIILQKLDELNKQVNPILPNSPEVSTSAT